MNETAKHPSIPLLDPLIKGLTGGEAAAAFVDAIELPIMILAKGSHDGRLRILHANGQLSRLCGFSKAELMGESPELLQGEDTDQKAAKVFREEVESDGRGFVTLTNYRKNGTPYEVFLLGALLAGSDRNIGQTLFASFSFHICDVDTALPRLPKINQKHTAN